MAESSRLHGARPTMPGLRVEPVQQRSSDRRERILDAAAALSDEVGIEQVTTAAIAARAGVAIGTVYRFFSDRVAVFRALTARHFQTYTDHLESVLAEIPPGQAEKAGGDPVAAELELLVDVTVDTYVRMLRDVPGFRGFGDAIDPQLLEREFGDRSAPDAGRDNDTVLADRLADLLATRTGIRATRRLRRAVLIAVTTADAVLSLAFRLDPAGDAAVIAEAKTLVNGYLRNRLGTEGQP